MAISYNRLWKQLIDHGLSKTDMMHRAKISTNVLARLSKGEPVSMDSMEKICTVLAKFDFARPKIFYDGPVPEFDPQRSVLV